MISEYVKLAYSLLLITLMLSEGQDVLHMSRRRDTRPYALRYLPPFTAAYRNVEPINPPVVWVHPCRCTLVAHENCLLNWIRSAQQDAARARNALKCPQCGSVYEIESDNPFLLRLLNNLSASASLAGKAVTVFGVTGVVVSCGFGE